MTQRRVRRRSHSETRSDSQSDGRPVGRSDSRLGGRPDSRSGSRSETSRSESRRSEGRSDPRPSRTRQGADRAIRERRNSGWTELRTPDYSVSSFQTSLTSLIEENAPLRTNTNLVLMYGPFQAEMESANGQGVASWLRECVRKHGLPSLLRVDYRQRAQVFRRDQFQPWLEPLLARIPS